MEQHQAKGYITKKSKNSGLFQDFFKEGIDLLQGLSGANWTDYNEHDPGVTILENLAYALTELYYKTSLPIEQILADAKGGDLVSGDSGFFAPRDIFTTAPITAEDYAKVIIDRIDKVKNAWVDVVEIPVAMEIENGTITAEKVLYDIKIEKYRGIDDTSLKEEVKRVFHTCRNLGEDLLSVSLLNEVELELHLEVTLSSNSIAEKVLAEIYYRVNDYLSGAPRFYSKAEMELQDLSIEKIYDGPDMGGRFIKEGDLCPRITKVEFEEMKRIITNIDEVISVDLFDVHIHGEEILTEGYYQLEENEIAKIEIPKTDELVGYTMEKIRYKPNIKELMRYWYNLRAENYSNVRKMEAKNEKEVIAPHVPLHIGKYYSIREQFPLNYGIGTYGVSQDATPKRKAQAMQLKAFLLPFEQLMVNYLEQLEGVYSLFDPQSTKDSSYNYGEVRYSYEEMGQAGKNSHSKKINEELDALLCKDKGETSWEDVLQKLNAKVDVNAMGRLHKAMDNMLSRYAEHFPNDILRKLNMEVFGSDSSTTFERKLLSYKRKFISSYAELGAHRLQSFDYTQKDNILSHSTLVQKMALLLAVQQNSEDGVQPLREVVAQSGLRVVNLGESKSDEGNDYEIGFAEKRLEGSFGVLEDEGEQPFVLTGKSENVLDEVLRFGVQPGNFTLKSSSSGKDRQYFVDFRNKEIVYTSKSKKKAAEGMNRLIGRLQSFNENSERIYLVEHKLLYPDYNQSVFSFTLDIELRDGGVLTLYDAQKLSFEQRNTEVKHLLSDLRTLANEEEKESGRSEHESKFIVEQGLGKLVVQWSGGASGELDLEGKSLNQSHPHLDSMALFKVLLSTADIKVHNKVFYGGACVDEDELNGQMTFVLPAWPVRFQHKIFRDLFEQLVFEHAPAYMLTHIKWLGIYEMLEFENRHTAWRKALSQRSDSKYFAGHAYAMYQALMDD
ncbi:hypothetical protein [Owenweeksia hongkongensis]|uniref:hypothetical protein n=1 Tax=Owenweeksia hongkongensis TaxID=253245 RepID=UPI003A950E7C